MRLSALLGAVQLSSLTVVATAAPVSSKGVTPAYLGFDSRLSLKLVARHRVRPDLIAFIADRGPLAFFYSTRVVLRSSTEEVEAPLARPIRGAVSLSDDSYWVLSGRRLTNWLDPSGGQSIDVAEQARISGSHLRSILVAEPANHGFSLSVRTPAGAGPTLALVPRAPGCYDWSPAGLAVIIDDTLLVAPMGSRDMVVVSADRRYASAMDVLQLDARRTLIATSSGVMIVAPGYRAIVTLARCRLARGRGAGVAFLDIDSGLVWEATRLEGLGDPRADAEYAQELRRRCPGARCLEASEAQRLEALAVQFR